MNPQPDLNAAPLEPQGPDTPVNPEPEPAFGWTDYAERINGRFAMVGFVLLIGLEFLTHQDLFTWLGLR
ncbi:MAG: high light inducible protein [Oscillatoriales cyanobacterium RM2_1_1]|nr:high light inducible protein [Oscillatoriales cyanobacterium SM2_3_0]NJO44629.1 high light inducible protein [Oscillatoriales cyanobacterium RM2_1_1]